MNVYDFDQTIFYPDSSYCFVMYCLRHYPRAVLKAVPAAAWVGGKCLVNKADTKALKEKLFAFLSYLDNAEEIVLDFWRENRGRIAAWYLAQKQEDDVIISASPEFLLRPVSDALGVQLIATPMDSRSGKIWGKNCHDTEKLRRFREEYPGAHVEHFYSDSLSDTPMAEIADRAFLVKDGVRLLPWPE